MKPKSIFVQLATLGPIGYLPASGTVATLVTLPFVCFFSFFNPSPLLWLIATVGIAIFALKIIGRALEHFKVRDPSEIVLDEFAGCFILFCAVPITPISLGLGVFLFRFFDILKPFGIRRCEFLYGSLGVVMDDILAGLFANVVLRIFLHYF